MTHKLGFIGCGNMGRAIIKGIVEKGTFAASDIVASDHAQALLDSAREELGINVTTDNLEVAASSIVVLAVKPQVLESVLQEIDPVITDNTLVISIAAGKSLAWISERLNAKKLVRLMPNMPAAVGAGMTSVAIGEGCTDEDVEAALAIVNSFGECEVIPEHLIDAATAVAGSSPAFVYMLIEAMADGAVLEGMPRAQAYRFAAQAVMGSAKMVLESGQHPAALKDAVCSPAGTTIAGVRVLEERGLRSAMIEAIDATVQKARSL